MKHAAPAYRTVPTRAWAAISEDVPPNIYEVAWYREQLRGDLRHIRVSIIPNVKKRKRRKPKRG
jgi:hypothetical protein